MAPGTCPKLARYREVFLAVAVGDTSLVGPSELDEAVRHCQTCYACSRELETYRELVASLTPPKPSGAAVAEVAARVRASVQARVAAARRRHRLVRWAGAVAAVAAALLVAAFLWSRGEARRTSPSRAAAQPPPPAAAPGRGPAVAKPPRPRLTAQAAVKARLDAAARRRDEGLALCREKRFAEAEVPLREALRLVEAVVEADPGGPAAEAAHYEAYRCHELLGDYLAREGAFRAYLRQVREHRGDQAAALALVEDARRLLGARGCETAGQRLEQALALCPTGKVAVAGHLLMGLTAERQRLLGLACSRYQMALAQGPPPELAAAIYRALISASARRGQFEAAAGHAEALCALPAAALTPEDRVVHQWLLARLYAQTGRTGRSLGLLRAIVAREPPERAELARLELARLAQRMTDPDSLPN